MDPVRGKRWKYRIRAAFDQSSEPINGVNPAKMRDPRLPLYLYLEGKLYEPLATVSVPDIPA